MKYLVFDILQSNGQNLETTPYRERKRLLQEFLPESDVVEYVPYTEDLISAWNMAIQNNHEGLIIKQLESAYEHERSYSWLKVKNWIFEVCHVVGFTPGKNSRSFFFGSLVLEKDGKFRGCVGSGFDEWDLRKFKDHFSDCKRIPQPFSEEKVGNTYTAVETDAQVLVKYYQVTDESGVMRFPIHILS